MSLEPIGEWALHTCSAKFLRLFSSEHLLLFVAPSPVLPVLNSIQY